MNIKDYSGVLVYIEQRYNEVQNVSLELLGKGRKIADELGVNVIAAVAGYQVEKHSKLLVEYGADKVVVLDHKDMELYSTEPYTQAMVQVIRSEMPEIVLFGATSIGRDLAPRVSARMSKIGRASCRERV